MLVFIIITSCRDTHLFYKEYPADKTEPKFINQTDIVYECERYLEYGNELINFKKRAIEMNNYCKYMDYKTSRFYKNEITFLNNYNFCVGRDGNAQRENKKNFNQMSRGSVCNKKGMRLVPFEIYVRVKEARQLDYTITPTHTDKTYQKFLKENQGKGHLSLDNKKEFKDNFRIDLDDYNRLIFNFKKKTAYKLNYFYDKNPHTYKFNRFDKKTIEIEQTYQDFIKAYNDGSCIEECNKDFNQRIDESGGPNSIFVKITYFINEAKLEKIYHPNSKKPFKIEKLILKDANSIIDNPNNYLKGQFQTLKNNKSEIVELIFWCALLYLAAENFDEIKDVFKSENTKPSSVSSVSKTTVKNKNWMDNRNTFVYVMKRYRMYGY